MDYDKSLNQTASGLSPSGIRKFFTLASTVPDCLSLSVGEPDFQTPRQFCKQAFEQIMSGRTHYTENAGLYELRATISKYLMSFIGVEYNPDNEILVTCGASEAIDITLRAILQCGDEVIIPEPIFVCYAPLVLMCGGIPIRLSLSADNNFALTPQALESVITSKTKCVILSYPNNPTGNVIDKITLSKIAKIIAKHNIFVLSDEIYAELVYDDNKFFSISSMQDMKERTVIVSGFSKNFAMTGWRIGYACAPQQILQVMKKIHQYACMCAPTPSQLVALCALQSSMSDNFAELNKMRDIYLTRRNFLCDRLKSFGFEMCIPQGTFYAFPSVKNTSMDGEKFAYLLLKNQKVAIVPGIAFGECAKDCVRISFASSLETIKQALLRTEKFLQEY